jgi:DNA-binding NtrC family response regulator
MRRRILYVEDDPTGREVAVYNLQKAGYDVTPASDGQEALSRFPLEKFDLVITDIRMPGLSGLELVRRIHRMVPCLPVIVVTAFGGMETAVEAMRGGACYFIAKPFGRAHLQLAVEKVLGGRFLADEAEALQVPVSEVERGIVCVFPNHGGSLLLQSGHPAPEAAPSQAEEKQR